MTIRQPIGALGVSAAVVTPGDEEATMVKRVNSDVTAAAAAASSKLGDWARSRRSAVRTQALEQHQILDGVRFGVKLAVGLGPETRFRIEWWHRLVARMRADGVDQVVLNRRQVEWLVAQTSSVESN